MSFPAWKRSRHDWRWARNRDTCRYRIDPGFGPAACGLEPDRQAHCSDGAFLCLGHGAGHVDFQSTTAARLAGSNCVAVCFLVAAAGLRSLPNPLPDWSGQSLQTRQPEYRLPTGAGAAGIDRAGSGADYIWPKSTPGDGSDRHVPDHTGFVGTAIGVLA